MKISRMPAFSGGYSRLQNTDTGKEETKKTDKSSAAESSAAASNKKNSSSLPDEVVKQIQSMAREGASKGVYMGPQYANFCKQYKQANITPDYSKLTSRLTSMLNQTPYTGNNLWGELFGYSYEIGVGVTKNFISVCDQSGDEVLFFDSTQGWIPRPSKAENQFHSEAAAIYSEAYSAARAEMKTQGTTSSAAAMETGTNFEMRA